MTMKNYGQKDGFCAQLIEVVIGETAKFRLGLGKRVQNCNLSNSWLTKC